MFIVSPKLVNYACKDFTLIVNPNFIDKSA